MICILVLTGEILFRIRKTKWAFLESVQKSGAAPTRAALVNQCRSDAGVLETLCEAVSFFVFFILKGVLERNYHMLHKGVN